MRIQRGLGYMPWVVFTVTTDEDDHDARTGLRVCTAQEYTAMTFGVPIISVRTLPISKPVRLSWYTFRVVVDRGG